MGDNGRMKDDALARQPEYRTTSIIPQGQEWQAMLEQTEMVWKADQLPDGTRLGLIPKNIKTKEQMLCTWLFGREIGVPPFQAMGSIDVIDGKPSIRAELMLALAYKNIKGFKFTIEASNEQLCRATGQRPGNDPVTLTFSIKDAERAGLLGKDSWRKYPAALLRARVTSGICRVVCPDAIRGLYTADELGRAERDEELDKLAAVKGVTLPQVGVNTTIDANYEEVRDNARSGNTE